MNLVTDKMWPEIRAALVKFYELVQKHPEYYTWAYGLEFEKACWSIRHAVAMGKVYYIDGYIVCIDVVTPWYSEKPVLQEWLTLRIETNRSNGGCERIPQALRDLAVELGCAIVMTADSSAVSVMEDTYKANGYKPLTRSFYSEV
jgi:hypothetical protein